MAVLSTAAGSLLCVLCNCVPAATAQQLLHHWGKGNENLPRVPRLLARVSSSDPTVVVAIAIASTVPRRHVSTVRSHQKCAAPLLLLLGLSRAPVTSDAPHSRDRLRSCWRAWFVSTSCAHKRNVIREDSPPRSPSIRALQDGDGRQHLLLMRPVKPFKGRGQEALPALDTAATKLQQTPPEIYVAGNSIHLTLLSTVHPGLSERHAAWLRRPHIMPLPWFCCDTSCDSC
jgi:hypothetical protein